MQQDNDWRCRQSLLRCGGRLFALLILTLATNFPAAAQTANFPEQDYGKIVFPARESTGGALNYVWSRGNVFEPIGQLRSDDPLARAARAVGRLDLLVMAQSRKFVTSCTAALVSHDLVITNYHCIPGSEVLVERASLVLDYLNADGTGARRIELETKPIEADSTLDYAIVRVHGDAVDGIDPIRFSLRRVLPKDRLRIIHHPAGNAKMMTQFRCSASDDNPAEGPMLRHTCDTLPGSSGAIIFDHDELVAVGLHHSGGLNANDAKSFNEATLAKALLERSAVLAKLAPLAVPLPDLSQAAQKPAAVVPKVGTAGDINNILQEK